MYYNSVLQAYMLHRKCKTGTKMRPHTTTLHYSNSQNTIAILPNENHRPKNLAHVSHEFTDFNWHCRKLQVWILKSKTKRQVIRGPGGCKYEVYCLLGCEATYSGR